MAEQLKFGDRLFLKGEKVLFDNGTEDAIIESRNGTLVIKGNLTVEGTTTTLDTESTVVSDPFILLNGDHTGPESENVGIEINRGDESNVKFGWDYDNDRWTTFGELLYSDNILTDTITAITSMSGPLISSNVTITGGNIDDTVIGSVTPSVAYFTDVTINDDLDVQGSFTTITTDGLTEGSNLYFTDERVDDRISNLFNASYGISALYTDPANTFEISFDAQNVGTGAKILDDINTTNKASFRTLVPGTNLDLSVEEDGDVIVIDTVTKINQLAFNAYTGTGDTTTYTMPYTVVEDWHVLVHIDGVVQEPTLSYTVAGTDIILSEVLPIGSTMNIIKMASNSVSTSITDADTLNAFPGSHYLDYTNLTNKPDIAEDISELTDLTSLLSDIDLSAIDQHVVPATDSQYDLGSTTKQWNVIYGHTVEATYADLAERYASDAPYEPGTVLVLGGEAEVTTTKTLASTKVIGIVSTDPGLKMNSAAGNSDTHPYIALKGRVPCKVIGEINRGDLLVTADKAGYAKRSLGVPMIGTVIGKAIGNNDSGEGIIEVFVSMM